MRVPEHAGSLDAAVEQLGRFDQLAPLAPEPAEGCRQEEEELSLAGRTRDRQRAVGVSLSLGVAIEIELDPGEPGRGLEVAGELVVRERIHERRRLRTVRFGSLCRTHHRAGKRELGECCRDQPRIPEPPRRVGCTLCRLVHLVVPRPPEGVEGQLEHQRHRLRRLLVGELSEGAGQALVRLILPSQVGLDAGTGAREAGAQLV